MNTQPDQSASYNKKVPWILHGIVTVSILLIAFLVITGMFSSKPEAQKWGGARPAPSVGVDVADLSIQDYPVWIDSYGTTKPLTETVLVADVNGKVVEVSPNIRTGKRFSKGEVLVQLDDRDFVVEVDIAAAAAAEAEVRYLQELAESELAAQQWNKPPETEAAQLLSLRKPQVAAAKASLRAANARLERAKLNLDRTTIRAPFDGKVLEQMVDVGQVINPSQSIAEIYSIEAVEVRLPVKVADLAYLSIDDNSDNMDNLPRVVLSGELGNQTYEWTGKIVRSEGAFDPATRMLYLVAQIDNPFTSTDQRPAVRIGQFMRAKVQGDTLENVFVIPRRAVSQDFVVAVVDEDLLKKRRVQPLWTDAGSVVVSAGAPSSKGLAANSADVISSSIQNLRNTDKLILTPTANLPDGTRVKAIAPMTESEPEAPSIVVSKQSSEDSANAAAPSTTAAQ